MILELSKQIVKTRGVTRGYSMQWERGYIFSPRFSTNGDCRHLYVESDASLRNRIRELFK